MFVWSETVPRVLQLFYSATAIPTEHQRWYPALTNKMEAIPKNGLCPGNIESQNKSIFKSACCSHEETGKKIPSSILRFLNIPNFFLIFIFPFPNFFFLGGKVWLTWHLIDKENVGPVSAPMWNRVGQVFRTDGLLEMLIQRINKSWI